VAEWILETDCLSKSYGGVRAVDNVTMKLRRGSITALIGPNGSGKSTLFNIISGVDKPDSGKIIFLGRDVTGQPPHKLFEMGLYRTFQNPRLFFGMTVLENTLLPTKNPGDNPMHALFPRRWFKQELEVAEKAKRVLKAFNLTGVSTNTASEISGGQIKLLQIALALMTDSKLILLDEPIAGVSPHIVPTIFNFILTLKQQGKTLLIIEHRLRELFEIADYVYVMGRGKLVASGLPNEILVNPSVKDEYLGSSVV
jgi:branched-chain amino acid transport system ATP-binding protein